ncbi:hypothetical protein FHG87_003846 [Trinorchestia longiramus]|nr:hypothetical protein FHG87_003846 [Trinorchestia longiramus]
MYRVLKEDLRKKPYKMMKRHELTKHHETMRAERSRHILNVTGRAQGTLSNVVFTVRSHDLNPLDFSIWSILETWVLATPQTSLESLKVKLQREWETIPQEQIRTTRDAFVNSLKAEVRNKGGYIK